MRASWRWLPWIGLVLVAVAVLTVGTHRSSHPSLQEKTMHIATLVRCPVCAGESAAVSQAPASVQIRDQIQQELSAGQSQAQILSGLVGAYGPGILEKPEARGVNLLLWFLPVVAVVAAIAGLGLAFTRWRPRRQTEVTPADRVLVDQALRGATRPDGDKNAGATAADGAGDPFGEAGGTGDGGAAGEGAVRVDGGAAGDGGAIRNGGIAGDGGVTGDGGAPRNGGVIGDGGAIRNGGATRHSGEFEGGGGASEAGARQGGDGAGSVGG